MWRASLALGAALTLAGCSNMIEGRVEDALVDSGLPQPMAECMAGRLGDQLTTLQMRKLARLKPEPDEADVPITISEFLERVRRVDDPQVLEVAAGAAAVCAFER